VNGRTLAVALVLLVFGLMLGLESRLSALGTTGGPNALGQMAVSLLSLERQNERLTREVDRLEARLAAGTRSQAAYQTLLAELAAARRMAGLTPEEGPGVVLTLTEPPGSSPTSVYGIHDTDLLVILNELKAAGATALAVNGQRVVATTEIRQTGSTFSINGLPVGPPFTIVALGNPRVLKAALLLQGGILDILGSMGVGEKIVVGRHLTVPAYSGTP